MIEYVFSKMLQNRVLFFFLMEGLDNSQALYSNSHSALWLVHDVSHLDLNTALHASRNDIQCNRNIFILNILSLE